ncbi:MAG: flagellar export chaperone FlgN [Phycisphaerales bacterium JB061]
MTEQQTHDSAGLVALVNEQLELYQKLDTLSVRQHDLVASEDTDGLLAVLGARQQLIEDISDSAARMAPYRARWDDHIRELKETDKETLRKGLDDLSAMMAAIAERDESDRVAMESRRDRVKEQISGVKRGSAAVTAYGGPTNSRGPRFQDREA